MINYLLILAIILVLIALKLTKFVAVAVVFALLAVLIARNIRSGLPWSRKKKDNG